MRKIDAFAHILPRRYLERLERHLEPRSIALVGATEASSRAQAVIANLTGFGLGIDRRPDVRQSEAGLCPVAEQLHHPGRPAVG